MLRTITGTTPEDVARSASVVFHDMEQDLRPYIVTALPPSAEGAGEVGQIGERRVMLQTVGSENRVRYFERLKGPLGDAQWREFPHREVDGAFVLYNQLIVEQDDITSTSGLLFRTATNRDNERQCGTIYVRNYDKDARPVYGLTLSSDSSWNVLMLGGSVAPTTTELSPDIIHLITQGTGPSQIYMHGNGYIYVYLGTNAGDDFNIASGLLVAEGDNRRVGIGTAAPGNILHSYGSSVGDMTAADGSLLIVEQASTGDAAIQFELTGGQVWSIGVDNSQAGDPFAIYDGATERLNISSTGDVTLSADLRVDGGDIGITTDTDLIQMAANLVTINGTLTATTVTGMAPSSATYIVQTANATLTNEQVLGVLATGLVKNTTTTGVLSIGVADTDYQQPVTWGDGLAYSAPTASVDYNATNLKITANQIDTIQSIATAASPQFAGLNLSEGNITNVGQIDLDLIRADAANGSITVELDAAAGADFIVGNNSALVVEGDTDRVGIGTATPDGTFHVHTATAGTVTAHADGDNLVVENNTHGGISILTPNDVSGSLFFGDPDNNVVGALKYSHLYDVLAFDVAYVSQLYIGAQGLGLGANGWQLPSANGSGVLTFPDHGATNPTMAANTAGLFSKDVSGTVEMFAIGEDGVATQISPHDPETGEWVLSSSNSYTGIRTCGLLQQALKDLEALTGKQYWIETPLPVEECRDWNTEQAKRVAHRAAEIVKWDQANASGNALGERPTPYVAKSAPSFIAKR